jgi:hypothetical protein
MSLDNQGVVEENASLLTCSGKALRIMIFIMSLRIFSILVAALAAASSAWSQNGVLREVWTQVSGSTVHDLVTSPNYPAAPILSHVVPELRSPNDWSDSYGQRLRAFLTPAASGEYTFWISGDDTAELWLSTDAAPANRRRIARVPGATGNQVWTANAAQQSAVISLVAGQRYYIEALMKEQGGADSLAVAWAMAPDTAPSLIPSSVLTPFSTTAALPTGVIVQAGANITQYAPNLSVALSAQAVDMAAPRQSATYTWSQVSGAAAVIKTPAAANTLVGLTNQEPTCSALRQRLAP